MNNDSTFLGAPFVIKPISIFTPRRVGITFGILASLGLVAYFVGRK